MAADAGHGAAAFGHAGRGVVRAAGAEIGRALEAMGRRGQPRLLLAQPHHPAAQIGIVRLFQQPLADGQRNLVRRQLARRLEQGAAILALLAQDARPAVGRHIVENVLQLRLDQPALFLHHQNLRQAGGKGGGPFRLQRPGHTDLVQPDAERGCPCLVDAQRVQRLAHIEIGFAGGGDAETRCGTVDKHAVQPVGPREGQHRRHLVGVQPVFLRHRLVRPANAEPAFRTLDALGQHDPYPVGIDLDRGGTVHRVGHALHADPHAGIARHRPANQPVIQDFLDAGRVQHRHHRIDAGKFGLVRQGRGFADMIVAEQRQHTAMARGAGIVGMLEHVAGAVHPRPLAVPDGEHTVIQRVGEQVELLAAPDRGGRHLLIHAGLEIDVVVLQELLGFPELLVERAQRRAAIAGDEAAGVQPRCHIALALDHRQAHQRLCPGQVQPALLKRVFVVEGNRSERHDIISCIRLRVGRRLTSWLARMNLPSAPAGSGPTGYGV